MSCESVGYHCKERDRQEGGDGFHSLDETVSVSV